ncbi:Uncharacterized protein APZ42_004116 [Daphnia magna]|uniref:Uncharacterized protein n=1 Tax=Daphnia magna TaxID=35525 RepID=A0A164H8Z1_9CRUS|nr:Uncharacterized protein APZ42_004116 [Daphnia magna]
MHNLISSAVDVWDRANTVNTEMHRELIEETSKGILYRETLNDYFIDEKDERSPVEISAVIHHHMAIMRSAMEVDAELQRMEDLEMNSPGKYCVCYCIYTLLYACNQ